MSVCRLLSLDTSTKSTGVAVFENGMLVNSYTLDGALSANHEDRLRVMIQNILWCIDAEYPNIIVVEQSIMTRNTDTFRQLSMIVGAVIASALEYSSDYYMYTPSAWRALISDEKKPRKREELKTWSKNKVKELYGKECKTDDEADAILIGRAYINMCDKQERQDESN